MNRAQSFAFAIAWISQTATAMVIYIVPSIAPLLKSSLEFTPTDVGTVVAIVFIGVGLTTIVFGAYGDRFGAPYVLIAAHLLQAASLVAAYFANSFEAIVIAFFGVGVGYSAVTPNTSKIIIEWFRENQRGSAMGLKQTGVVAGATLAGIVFPVAGVSYGFHASFLAGSLITLASSAVLLGYKNPRVVSLSEIDQVKKGGKTPHEFGRSIRAALRDRRIVSVGLMAVPFAAVQAATLGYTTLFLQAKLNYDPVLAGLMLSIVSAAGVFSRPIYGALSDRFLKGDRIKTMFIVAVTSSISLVVASQLSAPSPRLLVAAAMAALGFGALGWNSVFLSYAGEVSSPGYEATGTSLAFSISVTGQVLGAPIFGAIVDSGLGYGFGWRLYSIMVLSTSLAFLLLFRNWAKEREK